MQYCEIVFAEYWKRIYKMRSIGAKWIKLVVLKTCKFISEKQPSISWLNTFLANVTISYPLETFSFLVFSGGLKWFHLPEMG